MQEIITAVYIEDEQHCQVDFLGKLKEHCPHVQIMATCNNANTGMKAIVKHQPQIVFLDVDMPQKSGLQLLEELQPLINADVLNFKVIFTTGFEKYAIQALRLSALDYLLKPVKAEELKAAVAKYAQNDSTDLLKKQLESLTSGREKIILPTTQKIEGSERRIEKVLVLKDILYLKAEGNCTDIYFENGKKATFTKQLGKIQTQLPENSTFCRSSNSYIVNLAKAEAYLVGEGFLFPKEVIIPCSKQHLANCLAILKSL